MSPEAYKAKLLADAAKRCPLAKEYLTAHGRKASEVDAMPGPQAVLLYSTQIYNDLCDQCCRALYLPYPESAKEWENAKKRVDETLASGVEILPLTYWYVPRFDNCRRFIAETDRRIAALSILEAMRMYAAGHDGRMPEMLGEITEVPIPLDPICGSPFFYHRDGDRAVLESPAAPFSRRGFVLSRRAVVL